MYPWAPLTQQGPTWWYVHVVSIQTKNLEQCTREGIVTCTNYNLTTWLLRFVSLKNKGIELQRAYGYVEQAKLWLQRCVCVPTRETTISHNNYSRRIANHILFHILKVKTTTESSLVIQASTSSDLIWPLTAPTHFCNTSQWNLRYLEKNFSERRRIKKIAQG